MSTQSDNIDAADEREDSIAAETMHGDLMAVVLDELRAAHDVWQRLSEDEQDQAIERIKKRTREVIEDCVRIIATQGFTRIRAKVDSIAVKDGIKAVLTLSQHDAARHELIDAQGTAVYIVLADPEAFAGGTEAHRADPDQGALALKRLDEIGRDSLSDDQDEAA